MCHVSQSHAKIDRSGARVKPAEFYDVAAPDEGVVAFRQPKIQRNGISDERMPCQISALISDI
jgi:hypothetical protein